MTRIGARFFVEVHKILAQAELLGRSITVVRGSERFRIDFPSAPDEFEFMYASSPLVPGQGKKDPRDYVPSSAAVLGVGNHVEPDTLVDIRVVRVVANVDSPLSVEAFQSGDRASRQLYDEIFYGLRRRATELVAELCERLKLELDQDWIEPTGTYPRVVSMDSLVDIDAETDFGTYRGVSGSVHVVDPANLLTAESLATLQERLQEGPPHDDELLLAEAKYHVARGQPSSSDRATLIAAIAVELRTKRLLRALANPDRRDMLGLLLDNPHDWSMSAHGLFLKAIPVLAGSDLGPEHRALAKRVQKLFQGRNGIAHSGKAVSREDAREHVKTAGDAFEFMRELAPPAGEVRAVTAGAGEAEEMTANE